MPHKRHAWVPRAYRQAPVTKICPWGPHPFTVTYKRRHQKYCSQRHNALATALRRDQALFRRMGTVGGTRSGQRRRERAVKNVLTCVQGPMRAFGTALYLLGFMHGQNTAAIRMRKARHGR